MVKHKTALVCAGGGMRSAHGAGFLYALATELGVTAPDIVVGSSGNGMNLVYYLAGQYDFLRLVWTRGYLSTHRFISPLRLWRIMNIDYLINTVFREIFPLDTAAFAQTQTKFFISITDAESGETRYLSNSDEVDPFIIMRATAAAPIAFGKNVSIGDREYIDGEFGPTLRDHVAVAARHGARNIVVIDDSAGTESPLKQRMMTLLMRGGAKKAYVRELTAPTEDVHTPNIKILHVRMAPRTIGALTNNKRKLAAAFTSGVNDARMLKEKIAEFFSEQIDLA